MKWTIRLEHQYISHLDADAPSEVNLNTDGSIIMQTLSTILLCFLFYFFFNRR